MGYLSLTLEHTHTLNTPLFKNMDPHLLACEILAEQQQQKDACMSQYVFLQS